MIVDPLDHISFLHSGASMKTFGELFKRYRLKAGFTYIADFADAFAQNGYCYDESIFSHWQVGKRIPGKRVVLVSLILLFIQKGAIRSLHEANEFLESAGHGYLTLSEQEKLRKIVSRQFFT